MDFARLRLAARFACPVVASSLTRARDGGKIPAHPPSADGETTMASVNKVILVGNLGRDPELRYTQSGQAVANFTLATTDRFASKDGGERQERTEWHRIVAWGRTAESCAQYLSKGRRVSVESGVRT